MKRFEILWELPICNKKDMKLANAIGKIVPIDMLNRVATNLWFVKNIIEQSTIKAIFLKSNKTRYV